MRASITALTLVAAAACALTSACSTTDRSKNEKSKVAPSIEPTVETAPRPEKGSTEPAARLDAAPSEPSAAPPAPAPEGAALDVDSAFQVVSGPALLERLKMPAPGPAQRGTIVNAWASWCGPCRREFPMLIALRDNLKAQGIELVFVSVDEPESRGAALDFARSNGLEPPLLIAERPLGPFKLALNERWPGMLPATFLFDATARLRYFWGGPVYDDELLPIVEGFVQGKNIDGEAKFGLTPGRDFRGQTP